MNVMGAIAKELGIELEQTFLLKGRNQTVKAKLKKDGLYLNIPVWNNSWEKNNPWFLFLCIGEAEIVDEG